VRVATRVDWRRRGIGERIGGCWVVGAITDDDDDDFGTIGV
jgi:hypothetical protein